jgi:hypothetical protein
VLELFTSVEINSCITSVGGNIYIIYISNIRMNFSLVNYFPLVILKSTHKNYPSEILVYEGETTFPFYTFFFSERALIFLKVSKFHLFVLQVRITSRWK